MRCSSLVSGLLAARAAGDVGTRPDHDGPRELLRASRLLSRRASRVLARRGGPLSFPLAHRRSREGTVLRVRVLRVRGLRVRVLRVRVRAKTAVTF